MDGVPLDEQVGISADGIFAAWNWDVRVCLSSYGIAIVLCRVVCTCSMLLHTCYCIHATTQWQQHRFVSSSDRPRRPRPTRRPCTFSNL